MPATKIPIDFILSEIAAGSGLQTVARKLGLTRAIVHYGLVKAGRMPLLKTGRTPSVKIPIDRVLNELAAGKPLKTVARNLGLCHSTVRARLIQAGHPPPSRKGRPRTVLVPVHQIRLRQKRGESLAKICKSLGLVWMTVDRRIKAERRATIKNREKGLVL